MPSVGGGIPYTLCTSMWYNVVQVCTDWTHKHTPQEHIIDKWDDVTVQFHNQLIQLYQTKVVKLLVEYKERIRGETISHCSCCVGAQ